MATELIFHGGVGTVTGSNFELKGPKTRILIDCGLIQGNKEERKKNYENFKYNPKEIDYLLITHAHIDHIGRIPKLVKNGFKGEIYSTPQTRKLVKYMLEDAHKVLSFESKRNNTETLYSKGDVEKTLSLWRDISYAEEKQVGEFKVVFRDAGHILGSALIEIRGQNGKKIVFTGDLGNTPTPLLKNTEEIKDADYLVIESVYGDRNHEGRDERKIKLKEIFNKVSKRNGTLLIPVFSLEKTQVLLHEMNDLIKGNEIKNVPVFLDSPLAIKLTEVYKNEFGVFNKHVQDEIRSGDNIFDFPKLKITLHQNESELIHKIKGSKVIISASGMSEGGRIMNHEVKYLPDKNNALLFIGYQVPGSLGRAIKDGKKKVRIGDRDVNIKAEIITVDGYSSHKDSAHLLEFISNSKDSLKEVFVVMGEPKSALFLVQEIRDNLSVKARHPREGEKVLLNDL